MKTIKVILFDKDGTLLDFHSIWLHAYKDTVKRFLLQFDVQQKNATEKLYSDLGMESDNLIPDGIVASGTMEDAAHVFEVFLQHNGKRVPLKSISDWLKKTLNDFFGNHKNDMRLTVDNLHLLLDQLKQEQYILAIVTTDNLAETQLFLEHFGLKDYFDDIITADNFLVPKPDPEIVKHFCEKYDVHPENVAVVGDSPIDMILADKSSVGCAVGVLSGVSQRIHLELLADVIVNNVGELCDQHGKWLWEK